MKKSLIIVLAVVLVVSSLACGTMALYTSTVDDVSTGSITAKHFYVGGQTATGFAADVEIAPAETKTATFTITNKDTAISEVDIEVVITLTKSGDTLPSNMEVTIEAPEGVTMTNTGDTYTFTMAKNVEFTKTFTVKYFWNSTTANEADNAFIDKEFSYDVSITGTQVAA